MKKRLFIIIPVLIALIAFILVYRYYNKEDKATSLTVNERTWVENNKDKVVDFEVINNYPLYGENGEGVFFNFLKDFEKNINLEFNKIPYLKESKPTTNSYRIRIVNDDEKLTKKDLMLFKDNYVAVGKEYQRINKIRDMKNLTFGIFEEDKDIISFYLKSASNITYKTYSNIDDLTKALDNNEVNMIIIPNIMYLDKTIDSKYSINYYLTEINKKVVLTLGDNDKLNNIVTKYFNKWKETKYVSEYNESYLNYYLTVKNISGKAKANLISKEYTYGYIDNPPYEIKKNGKLRGIAAEYVNRINRLSNIEFKYKKYNDLKSLKKAIKKGEVDLYFDYYNLSDDKYKETISTFIEDYVVLAPKDTDFIINSFESLKNQDIVMVKDTSLYNYFDNNSRASIKKVNNIKDLTNDKSKLVVLDREVYNYAKDKYFRNYDVIIYRYYDE